MAHPGGAARLGIEAACDEARIDAIFRRLDTCHLPGAAVGIAIDGQPVYRKGFGLANMASALALSPSTRMRIGATTNHFAALAYLLLCEEGKAGIDDTIARHVPELHPVTHRVTMRQLMAHVSGLRDAFEICFRFSGMQAPASSAALLELYRDVDDVDAVPGTNWAYNHGGYLLLSAAIERITGRQLEEVLCERIFGPLGMHDTLLRRQDGGFVSRSAATHMVTHDGGFENSRVGVALAGEGGMASTVDDMLRWLRHMDAPTLGSASTWRMLRTPQTLTNGSSTDYGLGLMTDRSRGIDILWHPAGVWGGSAQMVKVPAAGLDLIVMANRGDIRAGALAEEILDACLPKLNCAERLAAPAAVDGIFRSPATGRIVQLFARQGRQIASIDGMDMPVEAGNAGVWRLAGVGRYLQRGVSFADDRAQPQSIRFHELGNIDELVIAEPAGELELAAIAGRYQSLATATEALVHGSVDQPQLTTRGRFGSVVYHLQALARGIWRASSASERFLSGIAVFDAQGFYFSADRLRRLPFRRCH